MYPRLCDVSEVSPGKMKQFDLKERGFLVANISGQFYCLDGMCTHAGAALRRRACRKYPHLPLALHPVQYH
jgi:nitrite reductase/ring-hydroxylating ferredoxin subunit